MQCERYLNRWAAKYTVPQALRNTTEQHQQPFLEAEFKVTKIVNDKQKPEGWFRVEGRVLPAPAKGETPIPVDISVPVLLTRSAADWQPPSHIVREDAQAMSGEPERVVEPPHGAPAIPGTDHSSSKIPSKPLAPLWSDWRTSSESTFWTTRIFKSSKLPLSRESSGWPLRKRIQTKRSAKTKTKTRTKLGKIEKPG